MVLLFWGLVCCLVFEERPIDAVERIGETDAKAPPDKGRAVAFMGEREADENDHHDENQHLKAAWHRRPQDLAEMAVGDV